MADYGGENVKGNFTTSSRKMKDERAGPSADRRFSKEGGKGQASSKANVSSMKDSSTT
jgi:hypothetical protein